MTHSSASSVRLFDSSNSARCKYRCPRCPQSTLTPRSVKYIIPCKSRSSNFEKVPSCRMTSCETCRNPRIWSCRNPGKLPSATMPLRVSWLHPASLSDRRVDAAHEKWRVARFVRGRCGVGLKNIFFICREQLRWDDASEVILGQSAICTDSKLSQALTSCFTAGSVSRPIFVNCSSLSVVLEGPVQIAETTGSPIKGMSIKCRTRSLLKDDSTVYRV